MAIINIKGVKIVSELYPVRLIPVFKDYLWGGTKLKTVFNKKSELNILAESWELSANKDGQSIIANGKYQGYGLKEYIDIVGKEIVGTKGLALDDFPILIKFIDAKKNLSVQVHPDDEPLAMTVQMLRQKCGTYSIAMLVHICITDLKKILQSRNIKMQSEAIQ